ncbi:MAG TPA: DUF2243 domain-containing protein [Kofleriaceae bacterium]|nr:DUF2243 domain-containing protein [Kofleriaceae bacterium]
MNARAVQDDRDDCAPLIAAGLFLGAGLGGLIDGIVFHQILQWHHMLSSRIPPVTLVTANYNLIWDGLFHAVTWTFVAVGVALLFRAGRRRAMPWSGRFLLGAMLAGWGLFDIVEGVIDHLLLGVHHVRSGPDLVVWDLGFLIFGAALMLSGAAIACVPPEVRSGRRAAR